MSTEKKIVFCFFSMSQILIFDLLIGATLANNFLFLIWLRVLEYKKEMTVVLSPWFCYFCAANSFRAAFGWIVLRSAVRHLRRRDHQLCALSPIDRQREELLSLSKVAARLDLWIGQAEIRDESQIRRLQKQKYGAKYLMLAYFDQIVLIVELLIMFRWRFYSVYIIIVYGN